MVLKDAYDVIKWIRFKSYVVTDDVKAEHYRFVYYELLDKMIEDIKEKKYENDSNG